MISKEQIHNLTDLIIDIQKKEKHIHFEMWADCIMIWHHVVEDNKVIEIKKSIQICFDCKPFMDYHNTYEQALEYLRGVNNGQAGTN